MIRLNKRELGAICLVVFLLLAGWATRTLTHRAVRGTQDVVAGQSDEQSHARN